MPRYERVGERSKRFWEITLDGGTLITRSGAVGTEGKQTQREWTSAEQARREHDKRIAEKTRRGYRLVSSGQRKEPPAPSIPATITAPRVAADRRAGGEALEKPAARSPDLEAAILAAPDEEHSYLVYGDWLQAHGDPRGELIALQHAGQDKDARRHLARHARRLLPHPEESEVGDDDEAGESSALAGLWRGLTWRHGFIRAARIAVSYDDAEEGADGEAFLEALLTHPSGRFLRELTVGMLSHEGDNDYQGAIDLLVAHRPPLRQLFLGDFQHPDETELSGSHLGDASNLWAALPTLQEVTLQSGSMTLGTIALPEARHFEVRTGGLDQQALRAIARGRWPRLETLIVWFGASDCGASGGVEDICPILDGEGLRALRRLGLKNAELTDELCQLLPSAKILPQLQVLDLSMGTMTDDGARALAAAAPQLQHLERIDVDDNLISDAAILAPLGAALHFGSQRDDRHGDDGSPRFVAVRG